MDGVGGYNRSHYENHSFRGTYHSGPGGDSRYSTRDREDSHGRYMNGFRCLVCL